MHSLMFYKICSEGETFVTLATFIWFLPSVNSLMFYQTSFLEKKKHLSNWLHWYDFSPVCILWCIIWWCFIVNHLFLVKLMFFSEVCVLWCSFLRETFFTLVALVYLFPIVLSLVVSCVLLDIISMQNVCHTDSINTASTQYVFFGDVYNRITFLAEHLPRWLLWYGFYLLCPIILYLQAKTSCNQPPYHFLFLLGGPLFLHPHLVHLIYQVHWFFYYWYLNTKVFFNICIIQ